MGSNLPGECHGPTYPGKGNRPPHARRWEHRQHREHGRLHRLLSAASPRRKPAKQHSSLESALVLAGVGRPEAFVQERHAVWRPPLGPGVRGRGGRARGRRGAAASLRSGATAAVEVAVGPFPLSGPSPLTAFQAMSSSSSSSALASSLWARTASAPRPSAFVSSFVVERTVQRPLRPPPPFSPAVGPRLLDELQGVGVGPLPQNKVADEGGHEATEQDCQRAEGAHKLATTRRGRRARRRRRELEAAWGSQDQPKPGHRGPGPGSAVRGRANSSGAQGYEDLGNVHGTMGTT